MKAHALRLLVPMTGLAGWLFVSGCASPTEEYFLDTDTDANAHVVAKVKIEKVAVLPFKAASELIGSSVSDMFVTELLRTDKYELVERGQMDQVLSESELALAGLSASKAVEVGNILGADGVVVGTVDDYSVITSGRHSFPVVGASARLIDCKTGKVVWSVDLAKKAEKKEVALAVHARAVVHEMMAALYRRWHEED